SADRGDPKRGPPMPAFGSRDRIAASPAQRIRQGRRRAGRRSTVPGNLMASLARRIFAEWLGTAFLLAAVVGSGIMAAKLAGGNVALALLCNTIPTGAILVVLILIFGPLSGAHFNPAVTLAFAARGELPWATAALYIVAQIAGGVAGVWAAHLMFDLPVLQSSLT